MRTTLLLMLCLAIAACSGSASQAGATPTPEVPQETAPAQPAIPITDEAAATGAVLPPISDASTAGEVNYACQTDADCAVKDVGNCCGYYPACVNSDSPTFPEQVKADCAKEGRMGICGFPNITGCECVEGRCSNITGPNSGSQLQ